ncbi:FecR family protein [Mangrovibacterium diazotrophicum]|uniref:FecR family protein n=1 Tax=Mangrovibacterium diazotrophicum TaxID=1261403 RepID=A0A419WA74_9BACT|nr:FecR family protein [Mangrovibacterium diazotrophicum]RKD92368.1 FecR family protein [Mangrovibacterium diazotrophicum]
MTEQAKNKWEELAAKLHGEKTDDSLRFEANDEDLKISQQILDARDKVAKLRNLKSTDKAWREVKGNMKNSRKLWLSFAKYAAVFVVAVLLTGGLFLIQSPSEMPDTFACISAPNGQISNVTLFDGTNVWLNAGSNLKYKQSFGSENREVYLEGEAFFSVTKNKNIPFIVHAGNSAVKVHGTQFNVKAYQNEPVIETVLVEGQVEFMSDNDDVMMKPGQQLLFSRESGNVETKQVNTDEFTSWKGGKIYFNDETLQNLTKQLERWYEVSFTFQNEKIKNYRFSGVINKDRSLEYTLRIIQQINKVKFETNKEQIEIMDK